MPNTLQFPDPQLAMKLKWCRKHHVEIASMREWWGSSKMQKFGTVFENQPKSRIQHCERSELRLHFEWTKIHQKWQKWSNLTSF